ncbi:MAG TPA: lysophospholipid acyltransferase family protein [Gemmatimonadales bacterium]|nr:lysophospholipid acyltransferase family protein [Gemmatimonadales bacterium]
MTAGAPGWRASRVKRWEARAIGAAGYPALWALGRTWRWRVEGEAHFAGVLASGHLPVITLWHSRILPSVYYFRHRNVVVITSDNFDGEWTARIIHRFGYTTARGSTSRNAARAALRAKRLMDQGHPVGITVDGPRGPVGVAQPGAVWMAKVTGNPLLPFHVEASTYWTAPSWDASQIPYPFSRIAMVIGEPFFVPADVDEAGFEAARVELEHRLNALRPRALALLED